MEIIVLDEGLQVERPISAGTWHVIERIANDGIGLRIGYKEQILLEALDVSILHYHPAQQVNLWWRETSIRALYEQQKLDRTYTLICEIKLFPPEGVRHASVGEEWDRCRLPEEILQHVGGLAVPGSMVGDAPEHAPVDAETIGRGGLEKSVEVDDEHGARYVGVRPPLFIKLLSDPQVHIIGIFIEPFKLLLEEHIAGELLKGLTCLERRLVFGLTL